jgi:ligand-binding sensor domain-containing protein
VADGLLKADTAGNILQRYTSNADNSYSLSGNQVMYTYTDDNRNLWVAVWGKGVDYTSLDKFHFNQYVTKAEAAEFKTDNFLRSVTVINDEVWCATQSGGIAVLDEGKKIKQVLKASLPASIEYLLADNDQVWAATFKGLFSINAITKQVNHVKFDQQPAANVASTQYNFISRLPNGDLLLSSNAGLYIARNETGKLKLITVKGISAADVYLTTYADATGQLYISKAFKGFGVYKLQGDSLLSIKQFPLQASIKCFTDTPDSLLWIGSTVGLIRFNKNTVQLSRIFTTRDGLSNQYIYAAVKDGQYLWLSTNAGINRFDLSTFSVKNFSAADGLQSNEYNTYSFCKRASGEILFGGVNGLNGFYPAHLTAFKMPPTLALSSVLVNDSLYTSVVNYAELNELSLNYEQNTIAFQFAVIDYVNAPAAHIAYMLEGYDRRWVSAGNKSFIRYVKGI